MTPWADYPPATLRRCYWDASQWLARCFPPWRWLVWFYMLSTRQPLALRRDVLGELAQEEA